MRRMKLCVGVDWDRRRLYIEDRAEGRARQQAQMEVTINQLNVVRGMCPMSTIITDTQKVGVTVNFLDKRGNPAIIDGLPRWASNNLDVAGVEESDDGYSATVIANGPIGHAQITVTADSLLGEEVNEITGILELDVVAGEAVSATLTAGTPEEQEV